MPFRAPANHVHPRRRLAFFDRLDPVRQLLLHPLSGRWLQVRPPPWLWIFADKCASAAAAGAQHQPILHGRVLRPAEWSWRLSFLPCGDCQPDALLVSPFRPRCAPLERTGSISLGCTRQSIGNCCWIAHGAGCGTLLASEPVAYVDGAVPYVCIWGTGCSREIPLGYRELVSASSRRCQQRTSFRKTRRNRVWLQVGLPRAVVNWGFRA